MKKKKINLLQILKKSSVSHYKCKIIKTFKPSLLLIVLLCNSCFLKDIIDNQKKKNNKVKDNHIIQNDNNINQPSGAENIKDYPNFNKLHNELCSDKKSPLKCTITSNNNHNPKDSGNNQKEIINMVACHGLSRNDTDINKLANKIIQCNPLKRFNINLLNLNNYRKGDISMQYDMKHQCKSLVEGIKKYYGSEENMVGKKLILYGHSQGSFIALIVGMTLALKYCMDIFCPVYCAFPEGADLVKYYVIPGKKCDGVKGLLPKSNVIEAMNEGLKFISQEKKCKLKIQPFVAKLPNNVQKSLQKTFGLMIPHLKEPNDGILTVKQQSCGNIPKELHLEEAKIIESAHENPKNLQCPMNLLGLGHDIPSILEVKKTQDESAKAIQKWLTAN